MARKRPTYSDQDRARALTIAEATSLKEASEQTGIPEGTIKRWRHELRQNGGESASAAVKAIAQEAIDEAKGEVREYVADRVSCAINGILDLVLEAVDEARDIIKKGPTEDETHAQWLRAVIGGMHMGVDKYQLLTGAPTGHQRLSGQVTDRHEWDITQRLITDPDAVDVVEQVLRRAADRNASPFSLDDQ